MKNAKRGQETANPVEVQSYLEGLDFPATRMEIIEVAENNDAPEPVLETIRILPDRQYRSAADVTKEIGNSTRGQAQNMGKDMGKEMEMDMDSDEE